MLHLRVLNKNRHTYNFDMTVCGISLYKYQCMTSTQELVRIHNNSAHKELVKKYNRQTQVVKLSLTISLFIWETRLGEGSFWIKVLTNIQNIMVNRLRLAKGPVQLHIESIIYMSTLPSEVLNVHSLRTGHSGSETFNFKFALNVMN